MSTIGRIVEFSGIFINYVISMNNIMIKVLRAMVTMIIKIRVLVSTAKYGGY